MAMMWLVACALSAWLAYSGPAPARASAADSWLSSISHNLRSDMADVLEMASVNYSAPVINVTYTAHLEFDMRAMGMLYNSTGYIIDLIANKQAYPEGVVSVSDGHVELARARDHWRPLLAHYAGPAAVLLAAALLVVTLPLAGLFWCCCYWCRVGRRRRPFDRKYDACLKGLLAILLIALLTLFLFGVVCAFATEEQAERGAASAGAVVRAAGDDAAAFFGAAAAHARHLLVTNYRELDRRLDAMITSSGVTVSVRLGEFSRAVSVTTLNKMVQRLDDVQADLRAVRNLTDRLRYNAERLNTGLRKVKGQLLQTLATCEQPQCIRLQEKYKIGQLDTEIQYSQMPDVSELLDNVTELLDSNIKADVAEGQKVFSDIQRGVQRSVDEHVPSVQDAVRDMGARLASAAEEVSYVAGNASERARRAAELAGDVWAGAYRAYGPYRRHASRGVAAALLAVTCLMTWGLVCGVCGKRPDVYGAGDCCNKGAGSKCLLCGVALMFAAGVAAALALFVYFAVGVASQRFICDPLTEPRGNRLFGDLEKFYLLERAMFNEQRDPDFNITSVLIMCHNNETLYETLQLRRVYDAEAWRLGALAALERRAAELRPAFPSRAPAVSILGPRARAKLRRLAATGLSDFRFDRIALALDTNVTSLALDALAAQLDQAAGSLAPRDGFVRVALELRDAAALLRLYHETIVRPLAADTRRLNTTALKLRDGLRFNHSSLKEAISYLMHETTQAEVFLNTQGPELMQNMTREFAAAVEQLVDEYLSRVSRAARRDVARCGPLSAAYNVTRDAYCLHVLMPLNGYWISLAWCLALLVPLVGVAARLARLYLHLDPYPGPLVEAEYLYDAYADRDNVPLANAYKAEKRGGRGAGAGGGPAGAAGDGGGHAGAGGPAGAAGGRAREPDGGRAAAALAPPLDAHHARRYNDMAPKHWEEGPPRYHGPTEYERPPPYYYPGPNDRQ